MVYVFTYYSNLLTTIIFKKYVYGQLVVIPLSFLAENADLFHNSASAELPMYVSMTRAAWMYVFWFYVNVLLANAVDLCLDGWIDKYGDQFRDTLSRIQECTKFRDAMLKAVNDYRDHHHSYLALRDDLMAISDQFQCRVVTKNIVRAQHGRRLVVNEMIRSKRVVVGEPVFSDALIARIVQLNPQRRPIVKGYVERLGHLLCIKTRWTTTPTVTFRQPPDTVIPPLLNAHQAAMLGNRHMALFAPPREYQVVEELPQLPRLPVCSMLA